MNICTRSDSSASIIRHYDGNSAEIIADRIASNIGSSFNIVLRKGVFYPSNWNKDDFDQFGNFTRSNIECLKNIPQRLFQSPTCGNGFKEMFEDCDCGLSSGCRRSCCDPQTCRLKTNTPCTFGKLNSLKIVYKDSNEVNN